MTLKRGPSLSLSPQLFHSHTLSRSLRLLVHCPRALLAFASYSAKLLDQGGYGSYRKWIAFSMKGLSKVINTSHLKTVGGKTRLMCVQAGHRDVQGI